MSVPQSRCSPFAWIFVLIKRSSIEAHTRGIAREMRGTQRGSRRRRLMALIDEVTKIVGRSESRVGAKYPVT